MQAPNPKKAYGDKKPPLHLLPLAGMIHQSLAHLDGNYKYTFENWNTDPVEKLTYIGAILRHVELYKYGENFARDTGVHNLGGVMACCAILLDAELNGKLIDNTRHSQAACDLLHTAEYIVERLKAAQVEREAAKEVQPEKKHYPAQGAGGEFVTCGQCKTDTECKNRDYCLGGVPPVIITAVTALEQSLYSTPVSYPGFTHCGGNCSDPKACAKMGECLGE
jgi:Domain of unknown function (DUF5664)